MDQYNATRTSNDLTSEQKSFISNLECATKIVKSWPKWKQDVLNEAMDDKKISSHQNSKKD